MKASEQVAQLLADCEGMPEYTKQLLQMPNGEIGACAIVRILLATGELAELWKLPPIVTFHQEFAFPRGRADFVLFHIDGSITIVEVKDFGGDREVLTGIGQLSLYAMQAGFGFKNQKSDIRRLLAAAVTGEEGRHLRDACEYAGVQFEPLGRVEEHQAARIKYLETKRENKNG